MRHHIADRPSIYQCHRRLGWWVNRGRWAGREAYRPPGRWPLPPAAGSAAGSAGGQRVANGDGTIGKAHLPFVPCPDAPSPRGNESAQVPGTQSSRSNGLPASGSGGNGGTGGRGITYDGRLVLDTTRQRHATTNRQASPATNRHRPPRRHPDSAKTQPAQDPGTRVRRHPGCQRQTRTVPRNKPTRPPGYTNAPPPTPSPSSDPSTTPETPPAHSHYPPSSEPRTDQTPSDRSDRHRSW